MNPLNPKNLALAAFVAAGVVCSAPALADEYQDTVALFRKADESRDFFRTAYGYAVFPTVGKAGVGIGGAYGKGRVYEKGVYVGDTSLKQVSVGLQLGGEGFSQIIFFSDQTSFKRFTNGEFEFGAEASAVAITAGANARAGTTGVTAGASIEKDKAKNLGQYQNGMAVFTVSKGGLMYQAAVAGQKFSFDKKP
jgi:lipid-binding SYLF domain-containing protein